VCSRYDDPTQYDPDPLSDPDYVRDAASDAEWDRLLMASMYANSEAEQREQRNERIRAAVLLFALIGIGFGIGVLLGSAL
jgi:hypothetical protein